MKLINTSITSSIFFFLITALNNGATAFVRAPPNLASTVVFPSTTGISAASTIDQATSHQDLNSALDNFLNGPEPTRGGGEWVSGGKLEEIYEFVGRSFAGSKEIPGEPAIAWLFDKVKFGSHKEKADLIEFFISFSLMEGVAKQGKIFAKMLPDDAMSAMTLVLTYDPNAQESLLAQMMTKWRELVHLARYKLAGKFPTFLMGESEYERGMQKQIEETVNAVKSKLAEWHKQHGPTGEHWYVNIVAANPDYQGQGQGSELMRRVMELADEAKMDCYLEAGNEKNMMFYEKFGFTVVAEKELKNALNDTPHTLYLMVRAHPCA